ncbi:MULTISPECIES: TAXI family TRAP transporter solute-binding subunit [unclassified Methylobacterium]|jgi:TRAP transporter TAXI family solute receptor|uniref:TAXI family TRAP transporter solute-binding subunit n=1 Tax=unclassified Methylobacterium TaxID=2615210 RepID=UPI0013560A63|nr:TAXI family TRAP transporter solute-binding subunit [Methylobacterium sp. 2A]MWV22333.1 TAXI family TRAP transporter solute-binding subunit [Methylobacterium sp. 2A]
MANRRVALLGLLSLLAPRPVRCDEPVRVSLATATPGGGFPAFGSAFADTIRRADPALIIEPRPSGGSVENLGLLQAGSVDLGLVQGEYAYPAFAAADGVTVLAPMYPTPGLFVVPAGSPIRSVADLRGRPVVLGTHQSGLTVMARSALAASGLDPQRDIRPILLDRAGDGPALVREGQADALWGGGLDWPGFSAMARAPGGARFFGPSEAGIARLAQPGAAMKRLTVPAGSFPGQAEPIETVGSWSFVLARPDFDGDAADRIVRALSRDDAAPTNPKTLIGLVPVDRINPATARYLRAAGLIRP